MGKYFETKAAPTADPQIWAHTKQMEDGLGGGSLVATDLVAGSKLKKGALIYWDGAGATRNVYPVKNALVVTGGTTTSPRVAKNHLFKVGEFGFVSGTAVTITAIDTTTSTAYDVITFDAPCVGAVAGAYIEQANAAGGAVAAVKGVYTLTIGTVPAVDDKLAINGTEYTFAAAAAEGKIMIGADKVATAANLQDVVEADNQNFVVKADGAKLVFTQKVAGTGAIPTILVTQTGGGTLVASIAQTTAGVAGSSAGAKYTANALLGESILDVQGGEPCTVVLWIFQAIEKSRLPYAASTARLADLSNLKFV